MTQPTSPSPTPQYPSPMAADPLAVEALAALLAGARRVVAFTGAGISTESGIPDYRGPGGVWSTGKPPTIDEFLAEESTRREYWLKRRETYPQLAAIAPNAGHRALVAMERAGLLAGVITQNIDGLHQKAGNAEERVIELHGTAHKVRCLDCGSIVAAAEVQACQDAGEEMPSCRACGGMLRSATILFGEAMPEAPLRRAIALAQACDAMVVVGSSLVVQPAARLPVIARQSGARLALVNRQDTPLDGIADVLVAGDAGPVLSAVAARLGIA